MAKQNKMTAGQEAAASTASAVSALLRCGTAGCTWCAISGLAAGVRCQGGISNERCCRLLPRRRLVGGGVGCRWWPRFRQILEKDRQFWCRFGLESPAHPIVELRCVDPALRHVFLQKSDGLVTVGIADSRFHGAFCRVGGG